VGIGGKFIDTGDTDEGGLPLLDFAVVGRSDLFGSTLAFAKALKRGTRSDPCGSGSANVDEFCVTHLPNELFAVIGLKIASFSAE
jgi:hypothetical protein